MEDNIESLLSNMGINYWLEDPERKIKDVSSVKEALEDELSFCYYE
jgi:hypothetical protein